MSIDSRRPMLYVKLPNGRYQPIREFEGWPSDGIWWVEGTFGRGPWATRQSRISGLPRELALTRAQLEHYREPIQKAVEELRDRCERRGRGASARELATAVLDAIARALGDRLVRRATDLPADGGTGVPG